MVTMEKLIRETDSMDENEKAYWIELLPHMTKEQKDRLAGILEVERIEILKLEAKYGKIATDEAKVNMREKWIEYLT